MPELLSIQPVSTAPMPGHAASLVPAARRMLFDWLVIGQIMPMNPASAVRGPRLSVKKGKTAVLSAEKARALIDAIDTRTVIGLRERALISLTVCIAARVGAAVAMCVEDVYIQGRRAWLRLHETGGKEHEMPCHHNLETWLLARRRLEQRERDGAQVWSLDV